MSDVLNKLKAMYAKAEGGTWWHGPDRASSEARGIEMRSLEYEVVESTKPG